MTSTPAPVPEIEFYSWRVRKEVDGQTRLLSDFNPMVDEFDIFELQFDTVTDAVEWIQDWFDSETVPDDYELVHYIGTVVPAPQEPGATG
jgi:hypothetical protein